MITRTRTTLASELFSSVGISLVVNKYVPENVCQ